MAFAVLFRHVRSVAKDDFYLRHVCSAAWNSTPTGRISVKVDICAFFENLSRKFKFHENRKATTGTLHEDQYTFLIMLICS